MPKGRDLHLDGDDRDGNVERPDELHQRAGWKEDGKPDKEELAADFNELKVPKLREVRAVEEGEGARRRCLLLLAQVIALAEEEVEEDGGEDARVDGDDDCSVACEGLVRQGCAYRCFGAVGVARLRGIRGGVERRDR